MYKVPYHPPPPRGGGNFKTNLEAFQKGRKEKKTSEKGRKRGKKEGKKERRKKKDKRTKNRGNVGKKGKRKAKKDDFAVTIFGKLFQIGHGKAFEIEGTISTPVLTRIANKMFQMLKLFKYARLYN